MCIAQHVKDPKARLPYSKIQEYDIRIEGLPAGIPVKILQCMAKLLYQKIITDKENLKTTW